MEKIGQIKSLINELIDETPNEDLSEVVSEIIISLSKQTQGVSLQLNTGGINAISNLQSRNLNGLAQNRDVQNS